MGHDPTVATDGLAAVRVLTETEVDVVLSDWMMPELDGIGLCEAVRNDPRNEHLYFVLVTARGGADDRATGFAAGVDEYLVKPISPDTLRMLLTAVSKPIDRWAASAGAERGLCCVHGDAHR